MSPELVLIRSPQRRSADDRRARRARRWAVRLDRGGLGVVDRVRLKRWLADDANARALAEARTHWSDLDALAAADLPASAALRRWRAPARPLRRAWAGPALAGAAAAGVASLLAVPSLAISLQADARTGAGEQRELVLDDGSRVLLNTGSAVDIRYSGSRRTVRLLAGEARFEVAPDRLRAFTVEASGGRITALGTAFTVRRTALSQGGGAVVAGIVHTVEVKAGGGGVRLRPGKTTAWRFGGAPRPVTDIDDPNLVGWTTRGLQFDGRPLVEVAAELDRYTAGRIVVIGQARALRVSGATPVRNPLGALSALQAGRHIEITRLPGLIVVRAGAGEKIHSADLLISRTPSS